MKEKKLLIRDQMQALTDEQRQIINAKRELARREMARRYLLPFVTYNFPEYDTNWHHTVIADRLERVELAVREKDNPRGIRRLIIAMPPRHGKSELASVHFPAWFLGRNPTKEIIATSYGADLAVDFGRKVRNKIDTPEFFNIFPHVRLAADSKAANKWNTNAGGAYVATGVGGAITGKGADILLIDDPFKNEKESMSDIIRQQKWDWYTTTAMTRLSPRGAIVIIMTRWHDNDFVGRIKGGLSREHWEILEFPAVAIKDEVVSAVNHKTGQEETFYRAKGSALWPNRFSLQELNTRKNAMSKFYWSALYQQDPVDEEAIEFKKEWFRSRKEEDVQALSTRRFLTVDTAGSMTDRSDFIGVVDNRVDNQGKWNIIGKKYRMSPPELIDFLIKAYQAYHYEAIGIEKTIYLTAIKPFLDLEIQKRNVVGMNIVELVHNNTAKILRIRALIPRYQSGMVYHVEGTDEDLRTQLIRFPKGSEDDIIDALAYQEQIAQVPFSPVEMDADVERVQESFDRHSPIGSI